MGYDDSHFDAPIPDVSARLVAALRLPYCPSRLTLLSALSDELDIAADKPDDDTWFLLDKLCLLIGAALDSPTPSLDIRPIQIAREAAFALEFPVAYKVMLEQNWGADEISNPKRDALPSVLRIREVPDTIRERLAARVEQRLWPTWRLWRKSKIITPSTS